MDEKTIEVFIMIAVVGAIILFGYLKYRNAKAVFKWNNTRLSKRIKHQLPSLLNRYSTYYKNLPEKFQPEFERRVKTFIQHKRFAVRNLPMVTDEMYVTLAAYATQISFGYPDIVEFNHFKTIIIYPYPYRSTITKKVHKGEVNGKGFIVLSWKDVREGGAIADDGYNLALHEMAHALQLENHIQNEDFDFLDGNALNKLWCLAETLEDDIRTNDLSFLREYASTNQKEFFAVCVENFFERPILLKQEHPKLYQEMVVLLKQDPIALFQMV